MSCNGMADAFALVRENTPPGAVKAWRTKYTFDTTGGGAFEPLREFVFELRRESDQKGRSYRLYVDGEPARGGQWHHGEKSAEAFAGHWAGSHASHRRIKVLELIERGEETAKPELTEEDWSASDDAHMDAQGGMGRFDPPRLCPGLLAWSGHGGAVYLFLHTKKGPTMFAEMRGAGAGLPQNEHAERVCRLWNAAEKTLPSYRSVGDASGWKIGWAKGWYVWDGRGNLAEGCSSLEVALREAFAAYGPGPHKLTAADGSHAFCGGPGRCEACDACDEPPSPAERFWWDDADVMAEFGDTDYARNHVELSLRRLTGNEKAALYRAVCRAWAKKRTEAKS